MSGEMSEVVDERPPRRLWQRLGCAGVAARLCRARLRRKVAPESGQTNNNTRSRGFRRRTNRAPSAQYSFISERLRLSTPPALQCALFCGGSRCKYEQPQHTSTAIQGLYSDWVTEDILAMARPNTTGIAARNILQQFHCWGIRSVINLQTPGEHASCGPPLTTSGFTYDPIVFMANDIYYYNFAWPDYGEATLTSLLDMAKVLSFALGEGRVAIHCHAGLGRTGVLIACYLVYSMRLKANDAIRLVRKKRPRSIQTRGQILCVQQFEHYVLPHTIIFSNKEHSTRSRDRKTHEFTLRQHLYRQRTHLHGLEERAFKYLPKMVYLVCERLLKLSGCHRSVGLNMNVKNIPFYKSFLVFSLKQMQTGDHVRSEEATMTGLPAELPMIEWRDPIEEDVERNLECVSRLTGSSQGAMPAFEVYEALVIDHQSLPSDKQKYIKRYRNEINHRKGAICKIEEEGDPVVLTGLLFDWLEGLKTPILDTDDLATIISHSKDIKSCVQAMKMEDGIIIEYLLRFVIRLRPLAANKKIDIIKRFIASLTHQAIIVNDGSKPNRGFTRLRDGTCSQVINFMLRMVVEIQKEIAKPGPDDSDVITPRQRLRIKAWK